MLFSRWRPGVSLSARSDFAGLPLGALRGLSVRCFTSFFDALRDVGILEASLLHESHPKLLGP